MAIASSYSGSIPGLKREHFKCDVSDEFQRLCIPTLTKSKVYSDGQSFYFAWTASYGRKEKYYLQATGNITKGDQWKGNGPKWWGFECRCSCPQFAEQETKTIASNYMEHHVCHHLQIALELCVDLMASKGASSPTSVTAPLPPSLPAPPSMEEEETGVFKSRTVSPVRETHTMEHVIIPRLTRFHFIDDSTRSTYRRAPTVTKAVVDKKGGEFEVRWQAMGGSDDDDENKCYNLRASGNIKQLEKLEGPQWWGFSVSCDCPDFLRQRLRCDTESGWTQNYVCPHLGRALDLARDPERTKGYNDSHDSEDDGSMDAHLTLEGSDLSACDESSMDAHVTLEDSEGENSLDAFLDVEESGRSTTESANSLEYSEPSAESEKSMDALLAVDGNDDTTSEIAKSLDSQFENSLDALLAVDGSDGSTSESASSLESQLNSIDDVSDDECSIGAQLSVE